MPGRLSVQEVQARADAQGKNIIVNAYTTAGTLANATCLNCGGQINVNGSTFLDPRCTYAGCKTCGDAPGMLQRGSIQSPESKESCQKGFLALHLRESMRTPS